MNIAYKIVHALCYAVSLLPFRVLYALSDAVYVVVYHLVGYRKKTVRQNLASSFPEKGKEELRKIERAFFHFLCDYIVETLKLLSISKEKFLQHVEYRGVEQIEECFDQGQTCAAILGHYCNWEYLTPIGLAFQRHTDAVTALIYHPLASDITEQLFLDIRQSLGGTAVSKKEILRRLVGWRRENRMWLAGYISDQSPKWQNIHLWLDFLGHDTPVFTGGERIMRRMNDAVFYVDMQRPSRGHYTVNFELITKDPASLPENEVTRLFFQRLEQTIRRDPRFYLWSHKRWKRTREEFDRRFMVVNGKVMPRDTEKAS